MIWVQIFIDSYWPIDSSTDMVMLSESMLIACPSFVIYFYLIKITSLKGVFIPEMSLSSFTLEPMFD